MMLPSSADLLDVPVSSADRKFIMTPLNDGLRLAGTVEFGGLEAEPNMQRAQMLEHHATGVLRGLKRGTEETTEWEAGRGRKRGSGHHTTTLPCLKAIAIPGRTENLILRSYSNI